MSRPILEQIIYRTRQNHPNEKVTDVYHALRLSGIHVKTAQNLFNRHVDQSESKSSRPKTSDPLKKTPKQKIEDLVQKYEAHLKQFPYKEIGHLLPSARYDAAQQTAIIAQLLGTKPTLGGEGHTIKRMQGGHLISKKTKKAEDN